MDPQRLNNFGSIAEIESPRIVKQFIKMTDRVLDHVLEQFFKV